MPRKSGLILSQASRHPQNLHRVQERMALGACSALIYSLLATVVNTLGRLVPTVWNAVIAATAIRAAMRPYSTAVAPLLFRRRLIKVANKAHLSHSPGKGQKLAASCTARTRASAATRPHSIAVKPCCFLNGLLNIVDISSSFVLLAEFDRSDYCALGLTFC